MVWGGLGCFGVVWGVYSDQSGLVTSRLTRFAIVWLNAFGRIINNHKYCELLVMRY